MTGEEATSGGERQFPRTLTRQELVASFQYSQGDLTLQCHLFRYLKARHPDLVLPAWQKRQLLQAAAHPVSMIVRDPSRHPTVDEERPGPTMLERMLDDAERIFNAPAHAGEPPARVPLIRSLAEGIARADSRHLTKPAGRGYRPNGVAHYNPYKDAWRSDLCYFGFQGKTTGLPDFDALFTAVAAYWRARWADDHQPYAAEVRDVIGIFNDHHPGMRVSV